MVNKKQINNQNYFFFHFLSPSLLAIKTKTIIIIKEPCPIFERKKTHIYRTKIEKHATY